MVAIHTRAGGSAAHDPKANALGMRNGIAA
jgi:hypothetical protein